MPLKKRKRKLSKQNLVLAVYGYVGLLIFLLGIAFFVYAVISCDTTGQRIFFGINLILCIWCLFYCWRQRELFFGIVEIQENGIVDRCFGKRTVFVPWEEIERVKVAWVITGVAEHHLFLNVLRRESEAFHRSKAKHANGFDYHIALDEENIELLKEHLPQRLKDMLGPRAFE